MNNREPGGTGRAPFVQRYRRAIADEGVRRGLVPFQESWSETRDRRIGELETLTGASFGALRTELATSKDAVRRDLTGHVGRFRAAAEAAGATVYEARTPEDANAYIEQLCRARGVELVVKGKSMVSEEIRLNEHMARAGIECVETDLGEWLLQLADDHPSHLVMPAIHLRRQQAARLLSQATGTQLDPDDIPEMVRSARHGLRAAFLAAGAGVTGANALIAESGSLVIVTNEGNGRLTSAVPPLHIVTASADKIVPTFEDAIRQIRLLARSATGQPITTYTSFITGPMPGHELHIVLIDNGRSELAAQPDVAEALRCIRCGACANVCPAYAMVGGHAFGHIYTGPIGLITTAFHHGLDAAAGPQSLCLSCGACAEVCPVDIPLPEQILHVRRRVAEAAGLPRWKRWALRAWTSRRFVAVASTLLAIAALPFRRGRFTRLPWLPAHLRWRTPPAVPVRSARLRLRRAGVGVSHPSATSPSSPRVRLLLQCITDRLLPEVAIETERLLRATGTDVDVPRDQHCCGLPAFDAGDLEGARRMARATVKTFEHAETVVTPAPSCAAMIQHDYPDLFANEPTWRERAVRVGERVFDLAGYLDASGRTRSLRISRTPSAEPVTVHRFCQSATRLQAGDRVDRLLRDLCGAAVTPATGGGACCGFGGQTSLAAPEMSALVLRRKLEAIGATGNSVVVTDNPGCLLHMRGGVDAFGLPLQVEHLAEYLGARLPADHRSETT